MQPDFWNDKRPAGVPLDIDAGAYKSVIEVFERSCKKFADRPAFSNMGVTLTYAELERHSAAFAGYLQAHTDLVPGIASRCRCPTSCITRSPCSAPCAPG
jgi:long-chain acyl-CoA synthetase